MTERLHFHFHTNIKPLHVLKSFYFFFMFWLYWVLIASAGVSPAVARGGYSLVAVPELLIAVASSVVEHRL